MLCELSKQRDVTSVISDHQWRERASPGLSDLQRQITGLLELNRVDQIGLKPADQPAEPPGPATGPQSDQEPAPDRGEFRSIGQQDWHTPESKTLSRILFPGIERVVDRDVPNLRVGSAIIDAGK
jgi:hypothetical protein